MTGLALLFAVIAGWLLRVGVERYERSHHDLRTLNVNGRFLVPRVSYSRERDDFFDIENADET